MPNDANTIIIMATEHGNPFTNITNPYQYHPGINSSPILRANRVEYNEGYV